MGCNCGKKAPSSYLYTSPTGQRTTYKTEVEAQARKIKDKKAHPSGITGSYVAVTR
jgi:hypothetical protein